MKLSEKLSAGQITQIMADLGYIFQGWDSGSERIDDLAYYHPGYEDELEIREFTSMIDLIRLLIAHGRERGRVAALCAIESFIEQQHKLDPKMEN